MAISTVNVDFSAILQDAATATGLLRVRLSQVGTVEDSETGNEVILPITWQETTLTDGAATLALVPNKLIEPSCTYYEIQLKSIPDCPKACAKLLLSGIMYVPDEDCNVLDLLISPPSPETANTASGYASQAKQAAQVAEYFAVQAGDRYDDVAEAAATALTDIGTAKQDALDAISTAQSGATEAISTAEEGALQAIGQARGAALDDIGTAQGTAIGAVQAEGNTQVGRVYDAGEDSVADVTAAQATAVSAVQAQQATSVAAVTAEGTRQTGLVTAEGTAQVNAVTQAGNGYVATMQGLVSDAQAARDAAQTAQGLAEDAQAAAESASTDAQGYAGDASTSAGQAAQSASNAATSANDAATSATVAQASAESIEASAEQIQTNGRNITNIQALLNGTLYREETDSAEAYSKTVPAGALPWASIDEIGGKTVVWNQLVPDSRMTNQSNWTISNYYKYSFTISNNTATINVNTDSTAHLNFITVPNIPSDDYINHKIYLSINIWSNENITGENVAAFLFGGISSWITNITTSKTKFAAIHTVSQTGSKLQFYASGSYLSSGMIIYLSDFYAVDLTLLYGAGNEPSTVAEFEAMFTSVDPAYNAGELMSAGVTEAVSEGKNLATVTGVIPKNSVLICSFLYAQFFSSITLSFQCSNVIYTNGAAALSVFYNGSVAQYQLAGLYTKEDGTRFAANMPPYTGRAYVTLSNVTVTQIRIYNYSNSYSYISGDISDVQVETASQMTPYSAPFSRTLPIPSAVQALPGYGWSAGTAYNYIDFDRKVYVQRVASVDLGTLTWVKNNTGDNVFFCIFRDSKREQINTDIVTDKYIVATQSTPWADIPDKNIMMNDIYIIIHDSSYTDAAVFKTAMSGIMLYYELATPIETDISSLLSGDNLIEVEPGGSLTFKNQHDDFRLPVPNSETFLVQATPELPTTDGTYTLQCTVTDGTPSVTWVTA